jgi:type II secretory pathway component PulJ
MQTLISLAIAVVVTATFLGSIFLAGHLLIRADNKRLERHKRLEKLREEEVRLEKDIARKTFLSYSDVDVKRLAKVRAEIQLFNK